MSKFLPITVIFLFLSTDMAHAGAVLYRIQMMKAQKQQQEQAQYMAEYQQYNQAQGGAQNQPQQPVQKTYEQTVEERNQAIAQAIVSANNNQVTNQQNQNSAGSSTAGESLQNGVIQHSSLSNQPDTNSAGETVDLVEVWKKLDTKSTVWNALVDDQAKVLTVAEYIDRYKQQGVKINAPPEHYVQMIDAVTQQNPQMLQQPFGQLLQVLAIIDYDFDNGMDKDVLAKHILGEEGFESNKKRIMQAQQQAQQAQQAQQPGAPTMQ